MDFVTLADTAWKLHRKLSGGEDDDFSNLSGGGDSSMSSSTITMDTSHPAIMQQQQQQADMPVDDQARPFLSPSAEAELFLLATNFLLCKS
jgi:hypothetical protein